MENKSGAAAALDNAAAALEAGHFKAAAAWAEIAASTLHAAGQSACEELESPLQFSIADRVVLAVSGSVIVLAVADAFSMWWS